MIPTSLQRIVALLTLLSAHGCGFLPPTTRYLVSAPEQVPPPLHGKVQSNGEASLQLLDLDLRLEAVDYALDPKAGGGSDDRAFALTAPVTAEVPFFALLVVFKPGQATYAFDPTKPTVRTPDGRVLHPFAYVGPGKYTVGDDWNLKPRGCFNPLKHPMDAVPMQRMTEPRKYTIGGTMCFGLAFDVRVLTSIELSLEGLDRQGQHEQVPALRFVRRAGRSTLVAARPIALEDLPR
jgi:hypothetical protein